MLEHVCLWLDQHDNQFTIGQNIVLEADGCLFSTPAEGQSELDNLEDLDNETDHSLNNFRT